MPTFVDAHTHLTDDELQPIIRYLIPSLKKAGIIAIVNSMDLASSKRTLELAEVMRSNVRAFVGVHPWASRYADVEEFTAFLKDAAGRIHGIGEVGLDRKYARSEEEFRRQEFVFTCMLEEAERLAKPVSVHSRGSQDDVIEMLSTFRLKNVLLHWFSGSEAQLRRATSKGYFISCGPTVVYSKRSQDLASKAGRGSLLTETDAPVKYGGCFEMRRAMPAFLPSVVLALSSVLRLGFDETADLVLRNSSRYLGGSL